MQLNEHALVAHVAVALATLVVQTCPHEAQSLGLLVVSTQPPLQSTCEPGHPDTHAYTPEESAHAGAPPSGAHCTPQAPQFWAVSYAMQAPLHRL